MWQIAADEPAPFELLTPRSIGDATSMAAQHAGDCAYLAGGSDLLDQLKHRHRTPGYVINLKGVADLRGISVAADSVSIGALTTLSDLERHAEVGRLCRALSLAAARVASPQIRHVGTVGGNLLQDSRCGYYRGPWHCYRAGGIQCDAHHGMNQEHAIFGGHRCFTVSPSDTAPALVALGARITVQGTSSGELPLENLYVSPQENITRMHRLGDGEILTRITVPVRAGTRSTFVKYAVRNSWDFALASVAAAARVEGGVASGVRIVLGGVAPFPWRSDRAEREVEGRRLEAASAEAAAHAAIADARPLAHNAYKVALVKSLVRAALLELAA
jgi:xanthine dehydrogenase YagS FAD-binding subunit